MVGLAADHGKTKTVMIDATYLKAHRTATNMGLKKGGVAAHSTSLSLRDKSAITSARGRYSVACRKLTGFSATEDMTLNGSEKR